MMRPSWNACATNSLAPTHRPIVSRADQSSPKSANLAKPVADFGELSTFLAQLAAAAPHLSALPLPAPPPAAAPKTALQAPPIADKLLLGLEEAALLTGLPRALLLQAIHDGTLEARKMGRAWKIKRRALDAFIDAL